MLQDLFQSYDWLKAPFQQITSLIRDQRMPHALRILYPAPCGESLFVERIIQRLLCTSSHENEPCGHCHACQLVFAGTHPDRILVTCEPEKQSISIDQIRALHQRVYEQSHQGGRRVIWIKEATAMTEAASNAVLKMLEEPGDQCYFILSHSTDQDVLATIKSRCTSMTITLPSLEHSLQWLQAQHSTMTQKSDVQMAAGLLISQLSPITALSLLSSTQWQDRLDYYASLSQSLNERDLWSLERYLAQKENLTFYLHCFNTLICDALKAKGRTGRFIYNRDAVPLVRQFAQFSQTQLFELKQCWDDRAHEIATIPGLNSTLMMAQLIAASERILFEIA